MDTGVIMANILSKRNAVSILLLAFFSSAASQWSSAQQPPAARPNFEALLAVPRPALAFREEWKQPPYTGKLNDQARRVTADALTNPNLELKLYGAGASDVEVYMHEGRYDLWNGLARTPVAVTLRDKDNLFDLTGIAKLRWIVRTQGLHVMHPVVKLADGTLLVGSHTDSTDGQYLESEMGFADWPVLSAYGGQHWFKLDPVNVVTMGEVINPDLSRVDEIGYTDLMPGGGHGTAGWVNLSVIELYAAKVPRQ
jgi:hypothetical protein